MKNALICCVVLIFFSLSVMAAKNDPAESNSGLNYLVKHRQNRAMENIRRRWGYNEVLDKEHIQQEESTRSEERATFSWERK